MKVGGMEVHDGRYLLLQRALGLRLYLCWAEQGYPYLCSFASMEIVASDSRILLLSSSLSVVSQVNNCSPENGDGD